MRNFLESGVKRTKRERIKVNGLKNQNTSEKRRELLTQMKKEEKIAR